MTMKITFYDDRAVWDACFWWAENGESMNIKEREKGKVLCLC